MEFKIGTAVKTKVEKAFDNGAYEKITLPIGTIGIVCEAAEIDKANWYLIELADKRFSDPTLGVFDYKEDELEKSE